MTAPLCPVPASAIAVCAFAALGGFLFVNTLYLQEVRHFSPLTAGVYTLPIAGMTLLFAPLSGRLVGRRGPRLPLLVGGFGIGLGGLLPTGLQPSTPRASLLPAYFLLGIGFGMGQPADHQHRGAPFSLAPAAAPVPPRHLPPC